ncbi:MAG: redoxin domain-containing protein [Ignavibacteria bacterium]|nr:redoxin domain-containing protein [Ignavibacteria bacterium]
MHLILSLLIISVLLPASLRADFPEVGKAAPGIVIAEWLTGEIQEETPLAGRTIILEFWATWCSPCIKAIPHMNALQSVFDEQILFLSITDESRSKVERFLQKTRMSSAVVIDNQRKTYTAYGVDAIPETFLIDSAGVVRWHGHPDELTEEGIREFLENDIAPYTWDF